MDFLFIDNKKTIRWNSTVFHDLSLPISATSSPNAFHLPAPTFEPFRADGFVGSVEDGGPCRCDVITIAPHGNGTHTECIGHVAGRSFVLSDCLRDVLFMARVVTVPLHFFSDGSSCILDTDLKDAWGKVQDDLGKGQKGAWTREDHVDALVIRTLPNDVEKRTRMWSGQKPAYVELAAMQTIHERGVKHLLLDLPSVDPEEDGGLLEAHKVFWQWPHAPRNDRTITELIYVDDAVPDGEYLLHLGVPSFDGDAAPSRPLLHPIQNCALDEMPRHQIDERDLSYSGR